MAVHSVLYMFAALFIAVIWHEAAHAVFALASSRGRVTLQVGVGPSAGISAGRFELRFAPIPLGGICSHDGGATRADGAIIAAAGPISSAFLAALAASLWQDLWQLHPMLGSLAGQVVVASAFAAVFTAIPLRYPGGAGDSDGLAVLRALCPTSRLVLAATAPVARPQRPLRAPFAAVLAICVVLAFVVSFWLGLTLSALFAFAWLGERSAA